MLFESMAAQLASAYCNAKPSDVEDDVSLCVWLRQAADFDATLEEAARIRSLLDQAVAELPAVVIYTEGGVVQSVFSNDARLRVLVVDYDDLKERYGDDSQRQLAEDDLTEGYRNCVAEVW